jgi:hypothetical protein
MRFSPRQSLLGKLCALTLLSTLTGCQTTMGSGEISCDPWRPIYWSKADTAGTIGQVKEHNAVGKAICGWGSK